MNTEVLIRKLLKPYTCKDLEDIVITYLLDECYRCDKKLVTCDLVTAYRWKYLNKGINIVKICVECVELLNYRNCNKCKIFSEHCYVILEEFYVCNWCCMCERTE